MNIRSWVLPLGIFAVVLTGYLLTMPRSITLEDAGLFQMVCQVGGIGHPPGYPLFTSICQPFTSLPVFSAGVFAGNLLSALFAAIGCGVFYSCCRALTGDAWLAVTAALVYGFSATVWSQAIIIEVYTLAILMFLICWRLLLAYVQSGSVKYLYGAVFVYSLSLTNHWPLMALTTPALLLAIFPRIDDVLTLLRQYRFWLFSILLSVIGLSPYLIILLQHDAPIAVFGDVNSLEGLVRYILRSAYNDNQIFAGVNDQLLYGQWLLRVSALQFGLAGFPFILLGLFLSFRKLDRATALSLVFIYLGSTFILNGLLNFKYDYFWQSVFKPYPVIAYLALAFYFALGVSYLLDKLSIDKKSPVALVIGCAMVFSVVTTNLAENNRSTEVWVESFGRDVLASLPAGSILFVRGDAEVGVFGYLHEVLGLRPDIELRSWENLVFSNRLASPYAGEAILNKRRADFIAHTDRPVYAVSAPLKPAAHLGSMLRYTPGKGRSVEKNPGMDQFIDYLLDLYIGGYITDANEQNFAYFRLLNFTRQYYALLITGQTMSDAEMARLTRLQSTFPGKLAILETLLQIGSVDKEQMLRTARSAEQQIPIFASAESLAVFYEYYARIELLGDGDVKQAIHYLLKSIELNPDATNTGFCLLKRLVARPGFDQQTAGLMQQATLQQLSRLDCTQQ